MYRVLQLWEGAVFMGFMFRLRKIGLLFGCLCFACSILSFNTVSAASQADLAQGILMDISYGAEPRDEYEYYLRYEKVPASVNLENGSKYWYKMTKCKDPSEWVAFTHDSDSAYYVMYADIDGKIQPYSKRTFVYAYPWSDYPLGIQVEALNDYYGASSGLYLHDVPNHRYYNEMTGESIHEYITAAMDEVRMALGK